MSCLCRVSRYRTEQSAWKAIEVTASQLGKLGRDPPPNTDASQEQRLVELFTSGGGGAPAADRLT
ncbi:uncharacterized protein PgNI_00326 [Pyricularia grisea]|uniref:Uncharacterized protein n=1 Tax=Pyricularia grisea TaxID=148305 RepID=A0A6P8BFH2_PYRGI|nr:uncharacterized protein PgNI_00326 [Pyricularia grisea]TLD15379.1 hypothetical protein PgNI_00326 [Pyricularia grisea]